MSTGNRLADEAIKKRLNVALLFGFNLFDTEQYVKDLSLNQLNRNYPTQVCQHLLSIQTAFSRLTLN